MAIKFFLLDEKKRSPYNSWLCESYKNNWKELSLFKELQGVTLRKLQEVLKDKIVPELQNVTQWQLSGKKFNDKNIVYPYILLEVWFYFNTTINYIFLLFSDNIQNTYQKASISYVKNVLACMYILPSQYNTLLNGFIFLLTYMTTSQHICGIFLFSSLYCPVINKSNQAKNMILWMSSCLNVQFSIIH